MPRETYDKFTKFAKLQNATPDEIWTHYPSTGLNNYNPKNMVIEASIIETYLLVDYLKKYDIKARFWYNNPLFIHNEKLLRIKGNEIIQEDISNVYFVSLRESLSHPFFRILKIILENSGGGLVKPNMQTMENSGCMNKFYAKRELYSKREQYLGDVIIPFNITQRDHEVFMNYVQKNLGDKIVLKKDCVQEGRGVIFKDLARENQMQSISKILNSHKTKDREVLISKAYEIEREYRCYFTKHGDKKTVYSIKQRVNSTDIDVYDKDDITIYKNIAVKWHEVKTDSDVFKFGTDLTKDILESLSFDTGCLEFAKTTSGEIVFFEVNQMAGPLPFAGEDTKNMTRYYHAIFDNMFKSKILDDFIKNNSTLVESMKECKYHYNDNMKNNHHLEGDVWTHTKLSYTNTQKYNTSIYVKWAIVLHDIGRVLTKSINHKKQKMSFGDFEGVSIFMAKGILDKTTLTEIEKVRIFKIIAHQYTIIDYIKYDSPSKDELLDLFKYEEELLYDLSQYVKCDLLGRVVDESEQDLYDIKKMDNFIEYTKTLKNIQKKIKDKKYTVSILVGPPCSRKTTWASENAQNSIVINRDSSVEEIGKKYNKHSYDEAYDFMRKNKKIKKEVDKLDKEREDYAKLSRDKNIIIDNPNLTLKNRKEWIDALGDTHIIKTIVFLSSFDELLICNKQRTKELGKSLSKRDFINKLKTFTFPLVNEGIDNIEYKF